MTVGLVDNKDAETTGAEAIVSLPPGTLGRGTPEGPGRTVPVEGRGAVPTTTEREGGGEEQGDTT